MFYIEREMNSERSRRKVNKNLRQDDIEGTDTQVPRCSGICHVGSPLVIPVSEIKERATKSSISEFRDSSAYKVVVIERQGAIRHSLVPK